MKRYRKLETLFSTRGYNDFKWIAPADIVVSQWVRMKCMYGCPSFGRHAVCPPNVPTVAECRQFFDEYTAAAIFHFAKSVKKPEDRRPWARRVNQGLLKLERDVFLSGYEKAFLLFMDTCRICSECAGAWVQCKNPKLARPTPEALAVDVFSTVRRCGFPIEVLPDYSCVMNRYAFLLIE